MCKIQEIRNRRIQAKNRGVLRDCRPTAFDPLPPFKIDPMNGRDASLKTERIKNSSEPQ